MSTGVKGKRSLEQSNPLRILERLCRGMGNGKKKWGKKGKLGGTAGKMLQRKYLRSAHTGGN